MVKAHARQMAEKHPVPVQGALGGAGGAGGEDDHGRIIRRGLGDRHRTRRRAFEIAEFGQVASGRPDGDDVGEIGQGPGDLLQDRQAVRVDHHQLRAAGTQPELQRLGSETQRQRHGDGAEAIDGQMDDHRLEALRQDDRDPVAARHAARCEGRGQPRRAPRQLAIAHRRRRLGTAILDQADSIRFVAGPGIGTGLGDVEPGRQVPLEPGIQKIVGGVGGRHGVPRLCRNIGAPGRDRTSTPCGTRF